SSLKVLELLKPFKDSILLNVMNQYRPMYRAPEYPEIDRRLSVKEYTYILESALDLGFNVIN
ncbi:MAG: radical SAM protein, partial [Thermotoga sp.]